jgi:hypothetical protein
METIIISLGGSLIIPDKLDTNFLKDFRDLIGKLYATVAMFLRGYGEEKTDKIIYNDAENLFNAIKFNQKADFKYINLITIVIKRITD